MEFSKGHLLRPVLGKSTLQRRFDFEHSKFVKHKSCGRRSLILRVRLSLRLLFNIIISLKEFENYGEHCTLYFLISITSL